MEAQRLLGTVMVPESAKAVARSRRLFSSSLHVAHDRTGTDATLVTEGTIKFISPMLDEIKRTAHLFVDAPNPDARLREAMFVYVTIVVRREELAVVIPTSALVEDGPVHFVFVRNGDVYQKQDIDPGIMGDEVVEVLAGLAPGDVVVTQGAYSLTQLRPKAGAVLASAAPGATGNP